MNVSVGVKSDIGRVREGNEDSFLVDDPLYVVADGMGGHLAGDVASSTAVDVISRHSSTASPEDPQTLAELIRGANAAIWEKASADPELHGMGTTCTLVLLDGATAHIAHVGDSRAYLWRDGQLKQITQDHTLVARMVQEGRIREEDAERHPQRSIITRALGVDADVDVDLSALDLRAGDRLLLCSDGLSSMIDHEAIASGLREHQDPQAAADDLVARANEAGGEDNVTVVVIDLDGRAAPPPAPPPTRRPETESPPVEDLPDNEPSPRRRWVKPIVIALVVLALIAGGGYFLLQHLRTNYWYVGVNEDDVVTIFQGRSEDLFGIDLDEPVEVTGLPLADLPENLRDNVEEGRTADSRADAEQIVTDLEQRARDLEEIRSQDQSNKPGTGDNDADGDQGGTQGNDGKKN